MRRTGASKIDHLGVKPQLRDSERTELKLETKKPLCGLGDERADRSLAFLRLLPVGHVPQQPKEESA